MAHLGLIAFIAAIAAFVVYTGRSTRRKPRGTAAFSMTPPRVMPGEYFTFTLDFPGLPELEQVYVQVACYSAVRTVLWKQHSGGAFFAQRDAAAPPGVQRFTGKGRFPSEAELFAHDVDPYGKWIWRIEAAGRRGGAEWWQSFDVPGRA